MAEEELLNIQNAKPMPLYINLNRVSSYDSQALILLLALLCRLQDCFSYVKLVDYSEKISTFLQHLYAREDPYMNNDASLYPLKEKLAENEIKGRTPRYRITGFSRGNEL